MEGLKAGRIVYFVFDERRASEVMRRRTTGGSIADRLRADPPQGPAGAQAHVGNDVRAGDIYLAMVVKVSDPSVNIKVQLDGSDAYWATSIAYDEAKAPGTWHWMFEGQATRYDATKQR